MKFPFRVEGVNCRGLFSGYPDTYPVQLVNYPLQGSKQGETSEDGVGTDPNTKLLSGVASWEELR